MSPRFLKFSITVGLSLLAGIQIGYDAAIGKIMRDTRQQVATLDRFIESNIVTNKQMLKELQAVRDDLNRMSK